jgi:rubrerythrin
MKKLICMFFILFLLVKALIGVCPQCGMTVPTTNGIGVCPMCGATVIEVK